MGPIGPYGQTSNVQFTANKAISSSTTRCKLFHIFKPKNMVPFHAAQFWVNAVVRIRTEDMIEKVRRSSNISDRTKCHLENEFRKRVISLFPVNCCFCQVKFWSKIYNFWNILRIPLTLAQMVRLEKKIFIRMLIFSKKIDIISNLK